ncbi:hypothetical protein ERHA55_42400 [Erwinia rhapontici]|nr:hypothetical protein ERHA55_42400 [Erwinia rhapontici]
MLFPQTIIAAIPDLANSFMVIMKALSLAFAIEVVDIFAQAQLTAALNYYYLEAFLVAVVFYMVIAWVITKWPINWKHGSGSEPDYCGFHKGSSPWQVAGAIVVRRTDSRKLLLGCRRGKPFHPAGGEGIGGIIRPQMLWITPFHLFLHFPIGTRPECCQVPRDLQRPMRRG